MVKVKPEEAGPFVFYVKMTAKDGALGAGWSADPLSSDYTDQQSEYVYGYVINVGKPDLVVSDISWSPESPKQGDVVTFTVSIKNQGTADADAWAPFDVQYYVDGQQSGLEPDDSIIWSLPAGDTITRQFTWSASTGSHTVEAYVDEGSFVPESNEGNNGKQESFTTDAAPPSLPFPNVWVEDYPSSINLGDWATITVKARNDGGKANWQSINISFPDNPSTENIRMVSNNLNLGARVWNPGEEVGVGYGTRTMELLYPFVEGANAPWNSGEAGYLTAKVRPEKAGTFTFYVKSVATYEGGYRYDPSSGTKDQQNEYVYVYTIDVFQPTIISFSPLSISVSMKPGEIIVREINILNESDSEVETTLWCTGAIDDWIGDPPGLSLSPKTSGNVAFAITVPPGTERGSYMGGIVICAGVNGSPLAYPVGTIDITVHVLSGGSDFPIEIPDEVNGQKITEIAKAYKKTGESYELFVSIHEEEPYYVILYHGSNNRVVSGSLVVNTEGNILSPISTPISIFSPPAVAINYHPDWDYLNSAQSYVLLRKSLKEGSSKISESIGLHDAILLFEGVESAGLSLLSLLLGGTPGFLLGTYSNASIVNKILETEDCKEHLAYAANCYINAANASDSLAYAWLHLSPRGGYTQAADLFADSSGPTVQVHEYAIEATTSLKESVQISGANAGVLDEFDQSISSLEGSRSISIAIVENIIESRATLSQNQRTAPRPDSIGAEVTVESEGGKLEIRSEVYDPEIQIEIKTGSEKIMVDVTSYLEEGRTVIVNIDTNTLPISEPSEIAVLYDGEEIGMADNYSDVLNPNNEDVPEYLILMGAIGIQVLFSIPHFSTHTITVTRAATFERSKLVIAPTEINAGKPISIMVDVTNTGGVTGTYTVALKIDGVVEAIKDVTLAGGATETVTFTLTKDVEGTYGVEIAGLAGTLTVTPKPTDLRLMVGIIAVLVIIGAAVLLIKRKPALRQVRGKLKKGKKLKKEPHPWQY